MNLGTDLESDGLVGNILHLAASAAEPDSKVLTKLSLGTL